MRKFFIATAVCIYIAGSGVFGYCQCAGGDDSAIEQSEASMGESLDSEISSDQAQGQAEMDTDNAEMDTGTMIR